MKTEITPTTLPTIELEWPEVAKILFAAKGITSGLWRVALKLHLAAITLRFEEQNSRKGEDLPTGLIGIRSIALFPADAPGPMTFDAAASLLPSAPGKDAEGATATTPRKKPRSVPRVASKPSNVKGKSVKA